MRVALFLVALLGMLGLSSAQLPFIEVRPSGDMWSARQSAAVELVRGTRTFYDGVSGSTVGKSQTNYIVRTINTYSTVPSTCCTAPPHATCLRALCAVCCLVVQLLMGGQSTSGDQTFSNNDVWVTTNGRQWIWAAGYSDGQAHPYRDGVYSETFGPWVEAAFCQVPQQQRDTLHTAHGYTACRGERADDNSLTCLSSLLSVPPLRVNRTTTTSSTGRADVSTDRCTAMVSPPRNLLLISLTLMSRALLSLPADILCWYDVCLPMLSVWTSLDGVTWTPRTEFAAWAPRYFASMVADSANNVYIAGGILDDSGQNGRPRQSSGQIWRTTAASGGATWLQMNRFDDLEDAVNDGPSRRAVSILLATSNTPNQLIWLTGVNTGYGPTENDPYESYLQDAWSSKDMGRTWGLLTSNVSYGRRDDANAEITAAGLIVLAGGYAGTQTNERYNDVWMSANGGYTWGLCVKDAVWDDRRYQMTLLDDAGYLWVMGGIDANNQRLGDMWRSTVSFNNVADITARCKVTIPPCGAGLLCNPGVGTLIASDGSGAYCDTCPYTFTGQATKVTTLTAFLVVFVILTVLALIALGYTYYKLRSAGTPSPIPLPASAQRWWNKTTAGGAIGSTDSSSTTNGDGLYQPLRIRDQV